MVTLQIISLTIGKVQPHSSHAKDNDIMILKNESNCHYQSVVTIGMCWKTTKSQKNSYWMKMNVSKH